MLRRSLKDGQILLTTALSTFSDFLYKKIEPYVGGILLTISGVCFTIVCVTSYQIAEEFEARQECNQQPNKLFVKGQCTDVEPTNPS